MGTAIDFHSSRSRHIDYQSLQNTMTATQQAPWLRTAVTATFTTSVGPPGASALSSSGNNCHDSFWRHADSFWRHVDGFSGFLSLCCLIGTIVILITSGNREVRLDEDGLVFAQNRSSEEMTHAMRQFRTAFRNYTKSKYEINIQIPHWRRELNAVAMSVSVHKTTISFFPLAIWIYSSSVFFQWLRYFQSPKPLCCGVSFDKHLYHPEKGPEFSRWVEYLFTSPFQVVLVSIGFNFGTVDTLLGQFGMQAALVLLGYDIEQQVKKMLKYKPSWTKTRMHHFAGRHTRLVVYLVLAWLLHALLWGLPVQGSWGIGGLYYRQKQTLIEYNVEGFGMPSFVEVLFWSQYGCFTLFGVVASVHSLRAFLMRQTLEFGENSVRDYKMRVNTEWIRLSRVYSILSVTAKTFLEVGFVMMVQQWKTWEIFPVDESDRLYGPMTLPAGNHCWTVHPRDG